MRHPSSPVWPSSLSFDTAKRVSGQPCAHPLHRVTSTMMIGPECPVWRYCSYLSQSASHARSHDQPSSATAATPSARTHHSRLQSSSYRSQHRATRGLLRMFLRRLRSRLDFGFSSMPITTSPSETAKVTGTRCGPPASDTVASRPTRCASAKLRDSSAVNLTQSSCPGARRHRGRSGGLGRADARPGSWGCCKTRDGRR